MEESGCRNSVSKLGMDNIVLSICHGLHGAINCDYMIMARYFPASVFNTVGMIYFDRCPVPPVIFYRLILRHLFMIIS